MGRPMTVGTITRDAARARIRDEADEQMNGWYAWLDELDAAQLCAGPMHYPADL